MAKDRIQMPSSMGGLVRYFDEYESKIKFGPTAVLIFIAFVILLRYVILPLIFKGF